MRLFNIKVATGSSLQLRKLFYLALLFILWHLPLQATTRTAASCSVADIQAQVNLSADGDTVLVPIGAAPQTWTTTLTIKVGVTLNGQGCVVTWPSSAPFGFLIVNADTTASAFITGFTFNGSYVQGGHCGGPIRLVTSAGTMPYRFYRNNVNDSPGGQGQNNDVVICPFGQGPGLIDHNTMTATFTGEFIQVWGGDASFDDAGRWETDIVPGGPNFLFLEDNIFINPSFKRAGTTFTAGFIASYYGAKWVARHNTITYASFDAHADNGHGAGVRWVEIYDNSLTFPTNNNCQSAFYTIRGGSGVAWGNTMTNGLGNCDNGPGMLLGPFFGSSDRQSGNWPLPYQAGRGIESPAGTFNYSPFYSWGNSTLLGTSNCSGLHGLCPNNGGWPSGNPYVEVGSSPNSSLCTGNRTVNHPANVCDGIELGPSTSGPQTLTRCESAADKTAGCPVSYTYAPYTYPHPLVSGAGSPAISLSPAALAFGNVIVGQTGTLVITAQNTGSTNLTITSLNVTGGAFGLSTGSCTTTLAPDATCTQNVVFNPMAVGAASGTLTFNSNAASGPNTVPLSGTGI